MQYKRGKRSSFAYQQNQLEDRMSMEKEYHSQ